MSESLDVWRLRSTRMPQKRFSDPKTICLRQSSVHIPYISKIDVNPFTWSYKLELDDCYTIFVFSSYSSARFRYPVRPILSLSHLRLLFDSLQPFTGSHRRIGLSGQDCVEMRRYFRIPPAIQAKTKSVPFTSTYMWNDRDCNEKNFFLCERPISDGKCVTQKKNNNYKLP